MDMELRIIKIADIIRKDRFRKDYGDLKSLMEGIEDGGLLQPIVINLKNELIAGDRRLEAYIALGRTEIEAVVKDVKDPLAAQAMENAHRKAWTISEAVEIGMKMEQGLKGRHGGNRKAQDQETNSGLLNKTGKTNELVAKKLGISQENYRKAKKVIEQGIPELIEAVDNDRVSLNLAHEIVANPQDKQLEIWQSGEASIIAEAKRLQADRADSNRKQRIRKASKKPVRKSRPASKCYSFIYMNPPWPHFGNEDRSTPIGTQPLKITDISKLPVDELASVYAYAILRTPGPRLGDAISCLAAWDFEVVDCIVGIKDKPRGGILTHQQHELLVIGKRINMPTSLDAMNVVSSLYSCKQITPGKTPPEAWDILEAMANKLKKIMLFPEDRKGWNTWTA